MRCSLAREVSFLCYFVTESTNYRIRHNSIIELVVLHIMLSNNVRETAAFVIENCILIFLARKYVGKHS